MESFGNYQTVREFYREGYKLVSTARSGERSGEEYAVKQLKFVAAITDPEHLQAAQREFLDSVNVQMQAASAGRFWAPIHQSGETEDGVYYITDYYLRSLEHPIQGRVKLSARVLHTIMTAVVEGLLELKTKCGRPHGALKTTNVLLGDESDPARLRVVLTDPLPTARIDAHQSTIDDFHAVGELIYRLILHRPFQALGGWPVEDSPEWQRLGKHGQAWRILCHRLLTPNLDPGTITLEDVAQQLAELKPSAKKLPLLGLVAGMILVATVVGFLVSRNGEEENGKNGNILIDKQQWSTLCYDYYNWLTYFDNQAENTIRTQLSQEDIETLSDDPYLDDLLFKIPENVAARKIDLNPEKFKAPNNTSNILESARLDPGEVVPNDRIEHLNKTFDYISEIKDGLRLTWPNLKIICQAETEFDKNWIAHGDIKSILDRFEEAFNQVGSGFQQQDVLLKELVNVVKKADEVDRIQKRWSSINKLKPLAQPIIVNKNEEEKLQEKEERVNLAKMDDILAELSDLQGYLAGNIVDPVQRLAAFRDFSFDSSALSYQWEDKRDALLQNITAEKFKDESNYPLYLEQLEKVDNVKVFLEQLLDDDQLPRGVPEYYNRYTSRTWFDRVFWKDKIDTKREEALGNILALDNIWTPENIPSYDFYQFQKRDEYQELKEEYSLYLARVETLTVNLAQIEDRLNLAYGLDETWADNNTTTIRKLYDVIAEQQEYRQIFDEFRTEITPVTKRMSEFKIVENEDNKEALLELAKDNVKPVEIIRVAWKSWRQLNQQENPKWPDSQTQPNEEQNVRDRLNNRYQNDIADINRRQELILELTQAENEDLAIELGELADRVREFASFDELIRQKTEQIGDQNQLLKILSELKRQGDELAKFVEGSWAERVAQSAFQEEHPLPFTADEIPSSEGFAAWQKNVVEPYYILSEDPRDEWDQRQAEIEALIAQYVQAAEQSNRTPEDFKPKLDDILGQYSKQKYAGIERNRQHINTGDQELKQLAQGVQAELEKLKPSEDNIAGLEAEIRKADDVPPLFRDKVWARVANQAVGDLKANTLNYWRLSLYVPEVKRQLRQLEDEFQRNRLPPINGRDWVADLVGAEEQAHNDAQAELISKITAMGNYPDLENTAFNSEKESILNKYRQWETDLQGVVDGLAEVKNLLDRGYTLEGNLSGDRKIAQLRNQLQENPVYALVDAKSNPILTRVATLEALPSASRRDDLVGQARQINDKENPEIVITIWSRLGEVADWPGGRKDLDQEESLRRQVDQIADRIRSLDEDHYQALSNELSRQGPHRWLNCFKRLSQHDEIKDAVDRMTDFGVDVDQQNDPRVIFNIKLCKFRERVSSLTDQEDNQQTLLSTQEFIEFMELADELFDEPKPEIVLELRKNLNDLVAEAKELMETPEASRSNLEQAGPAAALFTDKWTMESSDRQSVQYISPDSRQRLNFIFIRPGGGADSFYLSTTEVSLSLFVETIKSSGQGSQIDELLTRNVSSWKGPLGWGRNRYTDEIQRNMGQSGWLFRHRRFSEDFYPPELAANIKNPRPNHPIQGVSAPAAMYFAQLLGCRLPTAAEWRATYDKCQEEGGLDPIPNLRDRTWQTQFEYIQQLISDDQNIVYDFIPWMDMVFQGEKFQDILSADALDYDDSTLWFAEVDAGADQAFHHLVGNVAEFVYEDPEDFENWFQVASNQSAENVESYLKNNLKKLAVIGGSALSPPPPSLAIDESRQVDRLDRNGYSDVGFRLAFTAPSVTLADQIISLLTDQSFYLQIESLSGNQR